MFHGIFSINMTAVCCAMLSAAASAVDQPNVLFLISDDLSAEALGCYGNRQCRTPAIDGLARRGARFARAYCQYPVCGPSRAAIMSGMYCQAIGVTGNGSAGRFTKNLGDRASMSQLFRRHGYFTARVSKIYHMRVPGDITAGVSGPDHVASWTETMNCQGPEWMTTGQHKHLTNEKLRRDPDKHYNLGFGGAFYVVRGEGEGNEQPDVQAADKAIELMRTHQHEQFFLAVGFVRPHVPLVAPSSYFEPYDPDALKLPERHPDDWLDIPPAGISKNSERSGLKTTRAKQEVLEAYYAAVAFMDEQIHRVLAELDNLGLRRNTIVVFTSDHGYHLGEHEFWQKMSLHEESTRIPLIISVPGKTEFVPPGLAEQIDIYPTLAQICGLPIPEHCQGKSLVAMLSDPQARVRDAAYCLRSGSHMLRTERWALIRYKDDSLELYDMQNDPQQFTNLAKDPAHRDTVKDLQDRLTKRLERIGG